MKSKDGSLIFRRVLSHKLIPVLEELPPTTHHLEYDIHCHLVITEVLILNVSYT